MEMVIRNLSKTYPGGVAALRDVSLTIPGGMFGLLGPNGAGKSTLMQIIATLLDADRGSITLGDLDVLRDRTRVRRVLGYLPQEFGLYPKVTAVELLEHFAVLKGIHPRKVRREVVRSLLEQTNLYRERNKRLGTFSGGMRQRFGIAVALIGDPRLIIVDEPTAGLDPAERVRFLNLLSELGEDAVVILSTHIVDDVSVLCQEMAIIDEGKILLQARPGEAVASLEGKIWRRVVDRQDLPRIQEQHHVISTRLVAGETAVRVFGAEPPGPEFQPAPPDLEDLYFTTLKRPGPAREPAAPAPPPSAP